MLRRNVPTSRCIQATFATADHFKILLHSSFFFSHRMIFVSGDRSASARRFAGTADSFTLKFW